jgi:sugar phosphate permease
LNESHLPPVDLAEARPTLVRYQVLAAACTLAVIVYIHRVGFSNALPDLKRDLQLGDDHAGWLMAAFLIAYGGFEMPWGLAADRWGARHLLPLILLGWSLVTGMVALTGFFAFLLILRFLFGLFQAGAFPILSRMLTDWMAWTERGKAQGLIWMSTRLGGMVSPLLVLVLINWTGGWQPTVWILAGLGLLWSAAFWPWFRNQPCDMAAVNEAECSLIEHGRVASAGHAGVPWKRLLRSRSVWTLCLMYGCGGFAANFYVTFLQTYLEDHRHLTKEQASVIASLPFLCGAAACLLGGLLSDWIIRATGNRKWGRRFNGTLGTVVAGFGWLALNYVDSPWALAFVLCLIFFCNDLAMGPAWAACADIGERYAGTIGGAMNMIGNLFGAVGLILTGYLLREGLSNLLFVIFAISFWCGTLCWQGVDATERLSGTDDKMA